MVPASKQVDTVGATVTVREGWNRHNAHWHDFDSCLLTNRTGVTLAVGDVVTLDTANDKSVVASDAQNSLQPYVVAQASIANGATGEFGRCGVMPVNVTGATFRGRLLRKGTGTRTAEDSGQWAYEDYVQGGALGIALSGAAAAGQITALWFGRPFNHRTYVIDLAPTAALTSSPATTLYSKTFTGVPLRFGDILRISMSKQSFETVSQNNQYEVRVNGVSIVMSQLGITPTDWDFAHVELAVQASNVIAGVILMDRYEANFGYGIGKTAGLPDITLGTWTLEVIGRFTGTDLSKAFQMDYVFIELMRGT